MKAWNLCAAVVAVWLLLGAWCADCCAQAVPAPPPEARRARTARPPQLVRMAWPEGGLAFCYPEGWRVEKNAQPGRVMLNAVAPDRESRFNLIWFSGLAPTASALSVEGEIEKGLANSQPGLKFSNLRGNANGSRVAVDLSYTGDTGLPTKAKWFVAKSGSEAFLFSYAAPADRFEEKKWGPLTVLSNLRIFRSPDEQLGVSAEEEARAPGPNTPMGVYTAPDGSISITMPQAWKVASAGGFISVVEGDVARAGFTLQCYKVYDPNKFMALGVNPKSLPNIWLSRPLAPADAFLFITRKLGQGASMQITDTEEDMQAQNYAMMLGGGRSCSAATLTATFTASDGTPCVGQFWVMVMVSVFSPEWQVLVQGAWCPGKPALAARYYPVLAQMIESCRVNQKWLAQAMAAAVARYRAVVQKTNEVMARTRQEIHDTVMAAWQERQRSQDWIDHNRTQYIRGEQDYVSELECGKIYTANSDGMLDRTTGDLFVGPDNTCTNTTGQNPRQPIEIMNPITDRQAYERTCGIAP